LIHILRQKLAARYGFQSLQTSFEDKKNTLHE